MRRSRVKEEWVILLCSFCTGFSKTCIFVCSQKHNKCNETLLLFKVGIVMLISCIPDVGMEGERGLVAGRSQREKRRSYKDLLREEEEIAAQVRKSSKKRPKVSCLSTIACPHGLISESYGVIAHFNILNLCV